MGITATEAKNRFGQLLEQVQRGPVVIEKSGRRHSVLMSVEDYDRLVAASQPAPPAGVPAALSPEARAFYDQYKEWVDEQHDHFEKYGVFGEEYRQW